VTEPFLSLLAPVSIALIAAAALSSALAIVRLIAGPTHADRIVALDILLAAGVVACIAASLLTGRTVFIDVGIGLALTGFVGTIGWARAVETGGPPAPEAPGEGNRP
jgi:multicomponent Na+:H+ antiporter subunit F